ncbi:MAG: bifunctional ornithine acetyltransferase/N-acetylglutamate synthase, partial [Mogibacterium sp.]|nr:bifunctional ornithine acetyltransferase/N-acetylglutamate synthase [Mogibacterium sp.]
MPFWSYSAIIFAMNETIRSIKYGGVTSPEGFSAGAIYAGVKSRKKEKPDVALLISDRPAACAAMFTRNAFCGAPVTLGRKIAERGMTRGVVLNSGNANAGTGQAGIDAALSVERYAEDLLGFEEDSLFVSSTGVIGEAFPTEKVKEAVKQIVPRLSKSGGHEAARAIMTTDRYIKEEAYELTLSSGKVKIGVMAKGSGMIHPNMATVLCFITTDACLDPSYMRSMLKKACDVSFNLLSVDGDTSSNDTLLMMANGASGVAPESEEDREAIEHAINATLLDISFRIASDGEGASKTTIVHVKGAPDDVEARRIARGV